MGEYNTDTAEDCDEYNICMPEVISRSITNVMVHENYRKVAKNKHDDIALLRLNSPVIYSDFVSPICLPLLPSQWNKNYTNLAFSASGWGD